METAKHPTYTITLDRFHLDLENCDNLVDTDARYVLVDQRLWQHVICPLINADADSYYALHTSDYSGPHAVTVS